MTKFERRMFQLKPQYTELVLSPRLFAFLRRIFVLLRFLALKAQQLLSYKTVDCRNAVLAATCLVKMLSHMRTSISRVR